MLQAGIVGLPNVGKSTLFNALTRSHKAEAANYPFCTIDPNVGVVQVPDDRLAALAKLSKVEKIVHAAIEFVDIAGLVAGASKGEGLGNKFLGNIREVDAIVHVVRCFEDGDIIHTQATIDPVRDIEIINTELMLADLESVTSQIDKSTKKARSGDKETQAALVILERLKKWLEEGKTAFTMPVTDEEKPLIKTFGLMTSKPVLFACNVAEPDLAKGHAFTSKVAEYAKAHLGCGSCVISARVESDLVDLSAEEAAEYMKELGVTDSGVGGLIRETYKLLGLASFFTTGDPETRAWTFKVGMKAPQCAGVIHTDFEKGFIKAEVVSYNDLIKAGSIAAAREAGTYRLEGKEYLFKDGDVTIFKFAN